MIYFKLARTIIFEAFSELKLLYRYFGPSEIFPHTVCDNYVITYVCTHIEFLAEAVWLTVDPYMRYVHSQGN